MRNILERIEASLDTIRPYLKNDGGDVKVVDLSEDMILKLEFLGACSSCSMSTMTFKAGIEEAIKRDVPEVNQVIALNMSEMLS